MATVKEIESCLFHWAPAALAASWDNVGLLVGEPDRNVRRVLVALDVTAAVVEEAAAQGADLIVAHHPLMNCHWAPVQTVRTDTRQGNIITGLIRNDIAAICMHTNLDAADGGVNDILAQTLGLSDIQPLCEDRIGRYGTINCEIPLVEFTETVVKLLSCNGLRYVSGNSAVHRVAVGGGACGEYISRAIEVGCDTFVTADLKYHDFLEYVGRINLIDAGHFPTEQVICPAIIRRLSDAFPDITCAISQKHDREIIQYCVKEK